MGEVLDMAEALWQGDKNTYTNHPFRPPWGIEPVAEDTWFFKGFAGTTVRETKDGLVIVDPSNYADADFKYTGIRETTKARLHNAIITHGHLDHAFGIDKYANEAKENGWPAPRVIAHEAMPARFKRYKDTLGWNAVINLRQFRGGSGDLMWPDTFWEPDVLYKDRLDITVGGVDVLIRHCRGETDDHSWIFFPDTKVLCPGDLFIWAVPNAGNPQKVQRYAIDWARGLREMASLEPDVLLPGHGFPIMGADRVKQALNDTATFLESVHEQTLSLMNKGATLDEVLHTVKAPEELLNRPYLHEVYDETEFIVRNIWRFYGGWYDGAPSHLKPAPEKQQATEVASLAGGAENLAKRAQELSSEGEHRLACHLADWAFMADPDNETVKRTGKAVYEARYEVETSTMALGIFRSQALAMGKGLDPESEAGGIFLFQEGKGKPKKD